jgi:glycosyltransferase involved in cell wall biosynthesis
VKVSVIVSTYNQPRALELVLWGLARQSHRDFEVVVADDGSGPETAAVIDRLRRDAGLAIAHVWHEDRGFRKTEIVNRAICASRGEYLIFADGDCIPREDFVATHARLARPGSYLAGGAIKLPRDVSERITVADVRAGHATDLAWLRAQGWRPGKYALRLLRSGRAAALLDWATGRAPKWRGGNSSTWRSALLAVNGYDNDMAYGGEDRALGERLVNFGLTARKIRYRAPAVHLDHDRPYNDPLIARRNAERCERIRRDGTVRAASGIAELDPPPAPPATA